MLATERPAAPSAPRAAHGSFMAEPNEFGGGSEELHSDGADSDQFERFDSGAGDDDAPQPRSSGPRSTGHSHGGVRGQVGTRDGAAALDGNGDVDADDDPFDDDF